jgi:hypothetical protein
MKRKTVFYFRVALFLAIFLLCGCSTVKSNTGTSLVSSPEHLSFPIGQAASGDLFNGTVYLSQLVGRDDLFNSPSMSYVVFEPGVIKGINTAGQALHPPPAAASAASREVLNPSFPHSLDYARASTVAISLRSSINKWHSHAGGQILIATDSIGYHQIEGQPVEALRPGDVAKCPPDVKHRHGAAPGGWFAHIAIGTNPEGALRCLILYRKRNTTPCRRSKEGIIREYWEPLVS